MGRLLFCELPYLVKKIFIACHLIFCCVCIVFAQEQASNDPIVISPDFEMALIGRRIPTLEEPQNNPLDLAAVQSIPLSQYKSWKDIDLIFGHVKNGKWFRFDFLNSDTVDRDLIFEIVDPSLYQFQFHRELPDGAFHSDTLFADDGFLKRGTFQENDGDLHRNIQLQFMLHRQDTTRCFLYVPPAKYPLNLRLYIWDKEYRKNWLQFFESYVLLTFYILSVIYLLLLGVTIYITRFDFFWFYFCYVFLGLIFVLLDSGLAYRYLWPGAPYLQQIGSFVVLNLYLICGLQFIRKYFNTKTFYENLDKALGLMMLLSAMVMLLSFSMPLVEDIFFAHFLTRFNNVVFVVSSVLLFVVLFSNIVNQQQFFPGLFLVGFVVHGVSIIISSLQGVGLIPAGTFSSYLMSIGHPLTIHLQLAFMVGMLIEMGMVFYLGMKRFGQIYRENNQMLKNVATQRQDTMNAMVQGIEQERERWSHELHDGLGVKLSLLKQEVAKISNSNVQDETLAQNLQHIESELDTAHEDLRNISHNIMPKSLRKLGLKPAIEELLHRLQLLDPNRSVNFYYNVDFAKISYFNQSQLYHIVQELLNNMNKHSRATEINLQFVQHQNQLIISLEDNGRGFHVNQAMKTGFGLKNIKSRVSVIGGKFMLESAPNRGTLISIEFPMEKVIRED